MNDIKENSTRLAVVAAAAGMVLAAALNGYSHLLCTAAFGFALVPALVTGLLAYFRLKLMRLEDEERRQEALARLEHAGSSMFTQSDAELEPFSAARARTQFERFVVPLVAPALSFLLILAAWRMHALEKMFLPEMNLHQLASAAFLAGAAFVLFILGRFTIGYSREADLQPLHTPGVYLVIAGYAALLGAVAAVGSAQGFPRADLLTANILRWLFLVLSAELLLLSVLQFYRPRRRRQTSNPYESRLAALIADPSAWTHNIAEILDYQFGYHISQTWFYRFMQVAMAPLVVLQLLMLYGLSTCVFIAPWQEGILEHFGQPVSNADRARLQPGFHLKLPWPFETVRRFPARRVQTINIGITGGKTHHGVHNVIWAIPHHARQDLFLVASRSAPTSSNNPDTASADLSGAVPVNLLALNVPVEFHITNVFQFAYNNAEPIRLLKDISCHCLTRLAVARGLTEMLGSGQQETIRQLHAMIQQLSDQRGLGIEITFVGIYGLHPPTAVVPSFEDVIGALEEREALILTACSYTNHILPRAEAAAGARRQRAQAYRVRRALLAEAETYRFRQRLKAYRRAPQVFKTDLYLRTLRRALVSARKYIITVDAGDEVLQFNLQQKTRPDLLNFWQAATGEEKEK